VTTDERILVLMPTAKDGERTGRVLAEAGLNCAVCKDFSDLCHQIGRGAAAALLTEEAIEGDRGGRLQEALRAQPPWSDFPLVVLARVEVHGHQIRESMNATLVERPVKVRSLLSVVRAALRSRRRQYEVRDHLAERQQASETIRRERERYRVTLASIGDAVIATDADGKVTFMNGVAESLAGWSQAEAAGRPLSEVFCIVHEHTREPVESPPCSGPCGRGPSSGWRTTPSWSTDAGRSGPSTTAPRRYGTGRRARRARSWFSVT
jgi:PAS domain-containing protein